MEDLYTHVRRLRETVPTCAKCGALVRKVDNNNYTCESCGHTSIPIWEVIER